MAGGYDNVGGWEDYDLWCRFAELGLRGQWQPQVLPEYRVHQSSMTKRLTTIAENFTVVSLRISAPAILG